MSAPKINIPNLAIITKHDIRLGEALQKIQAYVNSNTAPAAGNLQSPPSFANPTKAPG